MSTDATHSKEFAQVLRLVAEAVGKLTDAEWEALRNGKGRLKVEVVDKQKRSLRQSEAADPSKLQEIGALLRETATVEEAGALLDKRCPKKKDLEAVARFLELAVRSKDTKADLKNNILNTTIGARQRAEAIRGESGG